MREFEVTNKLFNETAPFSCEMARTPDDAMIVVLTGCKYGDKSDLVLYVIEREGEFVLTDQGRTRAYMNEVFELHEPDVFINILEVANYYGISTKDKQLSIAFEKSKDGFTAAFLKMMYCIGFLNTMRLFYV